MEFVADQSRADQLMDKWLSKDNSRAFYLDFEADNFHHYEEVLCTAQICYGGQFYLFDAINLDLTDKFSEILRTKPLWLHGCEYDLYLLQRFLKVTPGLLFDTQVAARLCGFRKFGYASLVEQICGRTLPKDSQRADWTKRPLPEVMIKYAENDVRYLPQISDLLVMRLDALGRLDWFQESCKALTSSNRAERIDLENRWRLNGSHKMKPAELNFLKELYDWRDAEAKVADRPSFKIINNNQLLDWASALANGQELKLPKRISDRRKNALDSAIAAARQVPEAEWPQKPERTGGPRVRINDEALQVLLDKRTTVAKEQKIEASCIASRKVLENVVKDPEDGPNAMLSWQRELLDL